MQKWKSTFNPDKFGILSHFYSSGSSTEIAEIIKTIGIDQKDMIQHMVEKFWYKIERSCHFLP